MNEGQQSTHSTCTGALLACMGNILISSRAERHTRTPRAVVVLHYGLRDRDGVEGRGGYLCPRAVSVRR